MNRPLSTPGVSALASGFDEGRALNWLLHDAVAEDGSVQSWINPDHPGYAYPEAAGLWLTLVSQRDPRLVELRDRVADRLIADISDEGGVGRDGVVYVFDSAIAMKGLVAHQRAGGTLRVPEAPGRLFDFVRRQLSEGRAVSRLVDEPNMRWSSSLTCHLLKLAVTLRAWGEQARPVVEALADRLLPQQLDGRFVSDPHRGHTYVHAACYAVEGLLELAHWGHEVEARIRAAADWLASIQAEDGSLPAWHDGARGWGLRPADVVAQSVRLWSAIDAAGYRGSIHRGLVRLAALQTASGGVRYVEDGDDVNTWCTLFAEQAAQWSRRGRNREWIA